MFKIKIRRYNCRYLWIILAIFIIFPMVSQAADVKLPIQHENQEGSAWCGCACITAVLNRYRTSYPEYPVDPGGYQ